MVQEAWYYTRVAGTDVVHEATTGWIPTAARGVDLQGVVIKYWGSVVTAATVIQVDWYTGILVFSNTWGSFILLFISFCHSHILFIYCAP